MTALRKLTREEKRAADLLITVCAEMETQARANSYVASPEQLRRSLANLADWSQGWANRLEAYIGTAAIDRLRKDEEAHG